MEYHYVYEKEINNLTAAFISKKLPKENWTHVAHLTVAMWHLSHYPFEEALGYMRTRIIAYNIAVGTENSTSSGYHETLTIFWIKVLDYFRKANSHKNLLDTCNDLLISQLAYRSLPFYFYEKQTILSPAARAVFTAADKNIFNKENLANLLNKHIQLESN